MTAFEAMKAAAGPGGWIEDPALLAPHLTDWRGRKTGRAALLLRPDSAAAVQAIVRIAAGHRIGIVPQGGNTSLCGGSVPEPEGGSVLLSLARMARIRSLDPADDSLVAEAGVTLQAVHDAAAAAGRSFPLSLAAKGSATVGGLVSTNAGGVQVLRWGAMRAQVLGLEAVLPDGSLLDQLTGLRKDNSGYDVKQLLIGAEGTLGIVTAATLRLAPQPQTVATAFVGLADPGAALALLVRLRRQTGGALDSFELVPRLGLDLVLRHVPGARDPLSGRHAWYALVEATSPRAGDPLGEVLESAMADAIEAGEIADAVVAASDSQRAALWGLREDLPEAERRDGQALKHDISVPVAAMPAFLDQVAPAVEARWPGTSVLAFGHLGDGNVHFNVRPPDGVALADFAAAAEVTAFVYARVAAAGGSISAEHGIGTLKRAELQRYGDPGKLAAMRAVKQALDPLGIMNPGKLL